MIKQISVRLDDITNYAYDQLVDLCRKNNVKLIQITKLASQEILDTVPVKPDPGNWKIISISVDMTDEASEYMNKYALSIAQFGRLVIQYAHRNFRTLLSKAQGESEIRVYLTLPLHVYEQYLKIAQNKPLNTVLQRVLTDHLDDVQD
jgi:hypothetical protein